MRFTQWLYRPDGWVDRNSLWLAFVAAGLLCGIFFAAFQLVN